MGTGNNSKKAKGITVVYMWKKLGPCVGVLFLRDGIFDLSPNFVASREGEDAYWSFAFPYVLV